MSKIAENIEAGIAPVIEKLGFELYFLEYVKEGKDKILRVTIDKEGGVSSDDCASVSQKIAEILDRDDPVPEPYLLEVCSPGIERVLRKESHFLKHIGETVKVSLFAAYEGAKTYEGILEAYEKERLVISCAGKSVAIPTDLISKVRIVFHFN